MEGKEYGDNAVDEEDAKEKVDKEEGDQGEDKEKEEEEAGKNMVIKR